MLSGLTLGPWLPGYTFPKGGRKDTTDTRTFSTHTRPSWKIPSMWAFPGLLENSVSVSQGSLSNFVLLTLPILLVPMGFHPENGMAATDKLDPQTFTGMILKL